MDAQPDLGTMVVLKLLIGQGIRRRTGMSKVQDMGKEYLVSLDLRVSSTLFMPWDPLRIQTRLKLLEAYELRKLKIGKTAPNYSLGNLSAHRLWAGLVTCFGL